MFQGWFKKENNAPLPDWLEAYQNLNFDPDSNTLLNKERFVSLDCEMTNIKKTADLITIGAVTCTAKAIYVEQILDQKYPVKQVGRSSEIHGELSARSKASTDQLFEEMIAFLGNRIIVGHNVGMDLRLISKKLKQRFGMTLKNKWVDTAKLAVRLDPMRYERKVGGMSNLHLDDLCKEYGIPIENRHTALGDAYLTALLFQRLLARLKKRGIHDLHELMR